MSASLPNLLGKLAARDTARTEADVQAMVRQLLLEAPLDLADGDLLDVKLESPAGGGRIDVEAGTTVIEVKKDLRKGTTRANAVEHLAGYVAARQAGADLRYVGVLTDGAEWRCYHLVEGALQEVSAIELNPARLDVAGFLLWLEGVVATAHDIAPTPEAIHDRLGARSSAHLLDRASLLALYAANRTRPSVAMKRHLWAKLLRTAFGKQFEDTDSLFIEHTLLVNSAEIIAHAVLGLPVRDLSPASLLSGDRFEEAGVHGVVEQDFFDWVIEVPEGASFVRTLARRLGRFAWDAVEHDVLKVLYESIIERSTRKKLGEYYTPDWLAEHVVAATVTAPLTQRMLDPACGSGTFLFHALRVYIAAAEAAGRSVAEVLEGATAAVSGMDLHPVAVALARVTYLLALGRARIADPQRGPIHVPVYLGDSMQWDQNREDRVLSRGYLDIKVDDERDLPGLALSLRFPNEVMADSRLFDRLVNAMAAAAAGRTPGAAVPSLKPALQRLKIAPSAHDTIKATFTTMCQLHDQGRDHIWGYYVRNLARPAWLARLENHVDVLIGNPPWLAYRHMPAEMQTVFRRMSESRDLWAGKKWATQQDLSALFVARTVQLYLARGGIFAFVMPSSVLSGGQYAGFRRGTFPDADDRVDLVFDVPWDLRKIRPHFFPITASVIRGQRASRPSPLPATVERWSGDIRPNTRGWGDVMAQVVIETHALAGEQNPELLSPYHPQFAQGAIVVPRMLFMVEDVAASPLGMPAGKVMVRSARSTHEKAPWRALAAIEGAVETEFVRTVYLGSSVLPFRAASTSRGVFPYDKTGLMGQGSERLELSPGLARWWKKAEAVWNANRSSKGLTLVQQLDYMGKFTNHLPVVQQRVVYSKSGMHLAAARVKDTRAVIDHTLYWATMMSDAEALYLCAVLNAAVTTQRVRPFMSYGKDERDIHKHVWRLPIPAFDPKDPTHLDLARLGGLAEKEIAALELPDDKGYVWHRQRVREYLATSPTGLAIDATVEALLGPLPPV